MWLALCINQNKNGFAAKEEALLQEDLCLETINVIAVRETTENKIRDNFISLSDSKLFTQPFT